MILLPLTLSLTACATNKAVNRVAAANIATESNKQIKEQVQISDRRLKNALQAVKPDTRCNQQFRSGKKYGDSYAILAKKLDIALTAANAHIRRCYADQLTKYQRLAGNTP